LVIYLSENICELLLKDLLNLEMVNFDSFEGFFFTKVKRNSFF
jgi:hypothetical protein